MGENKTYMLSKGLSNRSGKWDISTTGFITWDGVQGLFTITTSYNSPKTLMTSYGKMKIENGEILRDFILHYSEGEYMPFLKKTAPNGGHKMEYRQRWRIVDKATLEGVFEAKIDGEWKIPYVDPSQHKKEIWKKKT